MAGAGVGARILLNDPGHIILSIGAPVATKSLPDEEQITQLDYTFTASTPPNKAFWSPIMQYYGLRYLQDSINDVIMGELANEEIPSATAKEKMIHEVIDPRLLLLFAIVEHMDVVLLEQAKNPEKLAEEYARVLTNYALNRNLAYLYGRSR